MSFSRAFKKTFAPLGKRSSTIPHELVVGQPATNSTNADSEAALLSTGGKSVGTGDERDLIYKRFQGWKHLVKNYALYFENIAKAQKQIAENYKVAAESVSQPMPEDYLFLTSGSSGVYDAAMNIHSIMVEQSRIVANVGLVQTNNTISNLGALREEIKSKTKDYCARIRVIYENLEKINNELEKLKSQLEKAIEVSKIESEAPKAGDPYLINAKIKDVIMKYSDLENTMHSAVQGELVKLGEWEVQFISRLNSLISSYFTNQSNDLMKSSENSLKISDGFADIKSNVEWDFFKAKYHKILENPQNCNGQSIPANFKYQYMDNPALKVVKIGKLQREEIGYGNAGKFRECQAIITKSGFLHLIDETSKIKKHEPNVTVYLPSALLAPMDSPDLPRNAFMLYSTRTASKTSAMTTTIASKTKYIFRAENYDDMRGWWEFINRFSKDTFADRIFLSVDQNDLEESPALESNVAALTIENTPAAAPRAILPPQTATAQPTQPLMLTGTQAIGSTQGVQPLAYYPYTQPDGQVVYIPIMQNTGVEEPTDAASGAPQFFAQPQQRIEGFQIPPQMPQVIPGQQQQPFMYPFPYGAQPQMYPQAQPQMYPQAQPGFQYPMGYPMGFPQGYPAAAPPVIAPPPIASPAAVPVADPVTTEAPTVAPAAVEAPATTPVQAEAHAVEEPKPSEKASNDTLASVKTETEAEVPKTTVEDVVKEVETTAPSS
ncbi:hypothetical protein BB558_001629 [Smittium angustum]|uniref:PH domain-containing protein n=1 Tax=Smittium angustum TaxID=133377 RepID=A0A2U1JAS8_SMIAN|nr:hypothetical protein BB558_001629 [Smittium angustum]